MEVPCEREEEEVVGMDLNKTRTKKQISPTSSTDSSCLSRQSSGDTTFEYFASMNTDNNTNGISISNVYVTNGEQKIETFFQEGEKKVEALADDASFEETNVSDYAGTNGNSVHQIGSSVAQGVHDSDAGVKEMDVGSNGSSFSRSPNNGFGLKDVESLLNGQSENVITNTFNNSKDSRPEEDEYDVETVIRKQETHDLICPNCHSCITKRVILKRRKRKIGEISSSEEASESRPGVGGSIGSDEIAEESQLPSQTGGTSGRRFDAISCFSCFSLFIPTSRGFLCWRFKPKAEIARQPDDTPTGPEQADHSQPHNTGSFFPLWIVTCCQPADKTLSDYVDERAPAAGSKNQPTSEEGTEVPPHQTEPPLPVSDGSQQTEGLQQGAGTTSKYKPLDPIKPSADTSPSERLPPIAADEGNDSSMWFLTCCQPSLDRKKADRTAETDAEVSSHQREPPLPASDGPHKTEGLQQGSATTSKSKPLDPIKPDGGNGFSMWFLTCCQPSLDGKKAERPAETGGKSPPGEIPSSSSGGSEPSSAPVSESPAAPFRDGTTPPGETPSRSSGGSEPSSAPVYGSESPAALFSDGTAPPGETPSRPSGSSGPSDDAADNPVPSSKLDSPAIYDPETSDLIKPDILTKPVDGVPLLPHTAASGSGIAPTTPKSQPPGAPSDALGTQIVEDVEQGLLREPPRPGAGVDIIKAVVYGGLLESIISLSVITSAAGGDATTLNVVALGLANVFGGLIILVHNLRLLNHEHTTEHYEAQLGCPGHYMLHSVVAIISYLVFGLMSPVIYGFSFRKSDNKDYKLATLAAAALLSITVLSAAKAYVRNSPKSYFKTVFYYISLGFMVSGLGYVAGDLINMLLKKLGIFDSKAPVTLPLLESGQVIGAWSSH